MAQPIDDPIVISSDDDVQVTTTRTRKRRAPEPDQGTKWVFTINNPSLHDIARDDLLGWPCKYIVFQLERGDEETPHFQGAIFFNSNKRLSAVRQLCPVAHWECMRGTPEQAINYCTKADTRIDGPWEAGARPKSRQGKRTDLESLCDAIKRGDDLSSLIDSHTATVCHYTRGFQFLYQHYQRQASAKWRDVTVRVFWGKTGVGKTRRCVAAEPGLYIVDNYPWWDGYTGQSTILFDEFYGQIKVSHMLRLLDGYTLQLPVKGAFVSAAWTQVFITSNSPPTEWYTKKTDYLYNGAPLQTSSISKDVRDALMRRITSVEQLL